MRAWRAAAYAAIAVGVAVILSHTILYEEVCAEEVYRGTRLYTAFPAGEPPFPALIVVHGGWASSYMASSFCQSYAKRFAPQGYAVVSVDYSESPAGGRELEDVLNAVEYAKSNPLIDGGKVCAIGQSHGGYLVLMAAAREDLACVVEAYGFTDLKAMSEYVREKSPLWERWVEYVGEAVRGCREEGFGVEECLELFSPAHYAEAIEEPVLILHGRFDNAVPLEQSLILVKRFRDAGKDNYVLEVLDLGHGFSLLQGEPYRVLTGFLETHLGRGKV